MKIQKQFIALILIGLIAPMTGCSAIVAVGDAAITVGATAVKITAKTVGAVADAVIPSSDKKKEKEGQ